MRVHVQNPANGTDLITREQWDEASARAGVSHQVTFGRTREEFRAGTADAEAMIAFSGALKTVLPLEAPKLRVISFMSAGLDNLKPFDWLPPGVTVLNNSGTHAAKAGEYVLMGLLMLANRMPAFAADQQAERWARQPGRLLADRRLLVAGLGAIGEAVARLATGIGMKVTGVRTTATPHPHCDAVHTLEELDRLLPEADYLALTLPLTDATRHVLDRRRIALLPPGAGVVNVGRGGLIEQDALCDALEQGTLGGAVLDVFAQEPVPPGDRVWRTPNLVVTPHMSAENPERYNQLSLDIFFRNMEARAAGEAMPNVYDIARGY